MHSSTTWTSLFQTALGHLQLGFERVRAWAQRTPPWQVAVAFAAVGVLALGLAPVIGVLFIAALVCGIAVGWIHEFVFLMRTPPSAFPGRHDRWIWTAVMVVLAPIAWVAFRMYREAEWDDETPWHRARPKKPDAAWDEEGYL